MPESDFIGNIRALLKEILSRDGCRCDTSICNWCRTDGWVYVSPATVEKIYKMYQYLSNASGWDEGRAADTLTEAEVVARRLMSRELCGVATVGTTVKIHDEQGVLRAYWIAYGPAPWFNALALAPIARGWKRRRVRNGRIIAETH